MQVDTHSMTNNVVNNESDSNLADICSGNQGRIGTYYFVVLCLFLWLYLANPVSC